MSAHPESAISHIPPRTERRDRTTVVAVARGAQNGTYACADGPQAPSEWGGRHLSSHP
jgi:hypothetical protein